MHACLHATCVRTCVRACVWVPENWLKQILVPLYKKGAYDVCDNFRGIALLSIPGKVFRRVIQGRLKEKANRALRENQCGFRKGRGCVNHLLSFHILMEKAQEFHTPLYMCFVDLKKAYDSVNCKALWSVLQERYYHPAMVVWILKALHQETTGAVRAYGRVSGEFPIEKSGKEMYWHQHCSTCSLTLSYARPWGNIQKMGMCVSQSNRVA